jgi:hypothetical protein
MYMKALEQEVLRLKDMYLTACKDRDNFAEENRKLKELLASHGINFSGLSPIGAAGQSSFAGSSTGSVTGSYGQSTSTGLTSPPGVAPGSDPNLPGSLPPQGTIPGQPNTGINYDQVGIDFVLTYERQPYLSPPPQL